LHGGQRALQKEQVFAHLFPGEAFNMQKVHYISSYLLKTVEEFLAWQEWRKDEGNYLLSLMKSYQAHNQEHLFENTAGKLDKHLSGSPYRDVGYLRKHYELELERFNFKRTQSTAVEFRLQELSEAQDTAFVAEKLKNACILLSNQAVSKTTYDTGLLDTILPYLENHKLLQNPAVAFYYYSIKTVINFQDDASFGELKKLLHEHLGYFNKNELYDIFIFAINFCIRRLNNSEHNFYQEVFDIYSLGLGAGALLQNDTMTPRTYSNIIMSGLKLGEFDWVKAFIFDYKHALPDKLRDGFFNYNLARYYYEINNYGEAMPLLLQMDYEDVLLTCLGKILLAKMYYEQTEIDSLNSLLASFRTYVNRKKMLGYHKESTLNFIHFTSKLLQGKPNGNFAFLQKEIGETKVVAEKEWLLAQLEK
jgi:hypothetical protein